MSVNIAKDFCLNGECIIDYVPPCSEMIQRYLFLLYMQDFRLGKDEDEEIFDYYHQTEKQKQYRINFKIFLQSRDFKLVANDFFILKKTDIIIYNL